MSLRKAIDEKCKECIYDPHGGNGSWRQQVAACTSESCPLYSVRPMPSMSAENDTKKAPNRIELARLASE